MTVAADGVMRAPGAWRRFAEAVGALVVVAVGIPVGLIAVARITLSSWHPLPAVGSVSEIGGWFERDLSSSEIAPVLLRVLLTVAWLLWLGMVWSVLVSAVAARPQLGHLRLPRMHVFDGVGAWIVAGLTALSSLAPRPAEAAPVAAPSVVAVAETSVSAPAAMPMAPSTPAGWARVENGETIEEFAARTLGDGRRWPEVWAINRDRVIDDAGTRWAEVWRIDDGWAFELPADASPPGPRSALHVVDAPDEAAVHAEAGTSETAPQLGEYVVVDGDSYWRIAERTLRVELGHEPSGAAVLARTHQLIDINADRLGEPGEPHMLHTGDVVYLPSQPPAADPPAAAAVGEWVVQPDDSYWRIAEVTLTSELGRAPTDAETLTRTHQLIDINSDRLGEHGEPHMLHTGDVVYLPSPPLDVPAPHVVPTPPVDATATPAAPAPPLAPPLQGQPLPPPPSPATTPPAATTPRPTVAPSRSSSTPTPAPPSNAASPPQDAAAATPVGVLAGMSAIAAAGVAATVRFRRRRAAQRSRPHQRPAPVSDLEQEVIRRDVSDVTRLGQELRLLAHQLPAEVRSQLTVQLVQLSADAIEVAFAEIPAGPPPLPWQQAADRVWRLEHRDAGGDVDSVAEAPPAVPGLVTIGDRGSDQLLLNVEAPAGINLTGDPAMVSAWLTGAVWELAGAALSERPTVVLVDVDVPGVGDLSGVGAMTVADAAALIDGDRTATAGGMLHQRANDWEAWPPTLVVLASPAVTSDWMERAAAPDIAVIAVGGGLRDGLDIELVAGRLRIPAWQLEVPASLLSADTVTHAVEVLDAADRDPVVDTDLVIVAPSPTAPLDVAVADNWEPPVAAVTVNVLGEPTASRLGERLTLSPQLLSALAFLALHRDVSVDDFKEAMWGGAEVPRQRVADLLSAVRKAAGGRTVIGHIDDGRIRVGDDLGSDVAVFEALNRRAQEVPDELVARLHEMMYLVRGRPFAFPSTASGMWGWVDQASLEALWGMRVSTVAWELAGLYLDHADPAAARDVADRGLIADPLNGPLTERLMEAYAAMHAVEAAQRVYDAHDRALTARGFDGAAPETRRVLERLRAAHNGAVDVAVGS